MAADATGEVAEGCINLQRHCVGETCSLSTSALIAPYSLIPAPVMHPCRGDRGSAAAAKDQMQTVIRPEAGTGTGMGLDAGVDRYMGLGVGTGMGLDAGMVR